jgi:hypothetical protein
MLFKKWKIEIELICWFTVVDFQIREIDVYKLTILCIKKNKAIELYKS